MTTEEIIARLEGDNKDFTSSYFKGIDFKDIGLSLEGANFSNSGFYQCKFDGLNLSYAVFRNCSIGDVNFNKAVLEGAVFDGASCCEVHFDNANLDSAKFTNAKISKCEFKNSVVTRANFENAELLLTNFNKTNFKYSVLSDAKILDSDLKGTKLERVVVKGTIFDNIETDDDTSFLYTDVEEAKWISDRFLERVFKEQQWIHDLKESSKEKFILRIGLFIWKITSDYGRSIRRWAFSCLLINIFFGFVFALQPIVGSMIPCECSKSNKTSVKIKENVKFLFDPLVSVAHAESINNSSVKDNSGKKIINNNASSIMKCNTWESRKENAILSGYGKIQAININRKRRNYHHVIREEVIG